MAVESYAVADQRKRYLLLLCCIGPRHMLLDYWWVGANFYSHMTENLGPSAVHRQNLDGIVHCVSKLAQKHRAARIARVSARKRPRDKLRPATADSGKGSRKQKKKPRTSDDNKHDYENNHRMSLGKASPSHGLECGQTK